MTPSKAAPRKSTRGAAARSEVNGKGKTVKFRGLTLVLPPIAPGDLAFSLQDGEISVAVRTVFGPDQYLAIRQKCAAANLSLEQVISEMDDLIGACFAEWGTTAGE